VLDVLDEMNVTGVGDGDGVGIEVGVAIGVTIGKIHLFFLEILMLMLQAIE
jgi:hypothetical protein